MTQKTTRRRTGSRQANIVGASNSGVSGFGGLSGVAVNSGVSSSQTSSVAPVKQSGMSTVGGLQASGSYVTKEALPSVSTGSGSSSAGSGNKEVSGGASGGSSSGTGSSGSKVVSGGTSIVTQPATSTPKPVTPTVTPTVQPTVTPTVPTGGGSGNTIPVVVIEKPVSDSGGELTVETLPVVVIEKPVTGNVVLEQVADRDMVTQPVEDDMRTGGTGDDTVISAPEGFGDRFAINPMVEGMQDIDEDMKMTLEDQNMEEKVVTPGFGGIEGIVGSSGDDTEDGLDVGVETRPTTPGFGDKFYGGLPGDTDDTDDTDVPDGTTSGGMDTPAAKTPATSGNKKKWLWLIVAAVALWFIAKKK